MTDNEIVKALECCIKVRSVADCERIGCPARRREGCSYYLRTDEDFDGVIFVELIKDAIALINRQKAEIERLKEELDLVYEYHREKGIAFDLRSYKEESSGRCKSYHKRPKTTYLYHPITGRAIPRDVEVGICWGTKECDECTCGGDKSKCNFYPEKRSGGSDG